MTDISLTIAVLGLGEAGSEISRDLMSAGAQVRGFDPQVEASPGVIRCSSDADAARGSAVVIALTSAHEAEETLVSTLPGLALGSCYADLNTASAGLKKRLAMIAGEAGIDFADVALMSPVPGKGLKTPMLACGPGATRYAEVFNSLGATIDVLTGPPGTAASRKLVRSVFYKGLAASVTEALRAGAASGCEEWLRENISTELQNMDGSAVDRLEHGSKLHARRRADEMSAATELLNELGVPSRVTQASRDWLIQLLDETPSPGWSSRR